MPNQSDSQETGIRGEVWFEYNLPRKWRLQPPKTDVGVDGVIVICDESELNGLEFRAQIKSSKDWKKRNRNRYEIDLKKATLRYWFASPTPTLIVLYDETSNSGQYIWHSELWSQIDDLTDEKEKKIKIKIHKANDLTEDGWEKVREYVFDHYNSLANTLAVARLAKPILALTHSLSEVVKGLVFAHLAKPSSGEKTEEQEQITMLLDAMSHRDALKALRSFRSTLPEDAPASEMVDRLAKSYETEVRTFIHPFDIDHMDSADTAMWVNDAKMNLSRPKLIEVLLDTISKFTESKQSAEQVAPADAGNGRG